MRNEKSRSIPKYCLHKATNQGYVTLNGKRHYLGTYDKPETRRKYHQLVSEWDLNDRRPITPDDDIRVIDLIERYWQWAKVYYRKPDGTPTSQRERIRRVMRSLKNLYGSTSIHDFGPQQLKCVRQSFLDVGVGRVSANVYVGVIKHSFKWGVEEGFVPSEVYGALHVVSGLKKGRSAAKENEPIRPVPLDDVDATLDYVSPQIRALVHLQLFTGARPGELVGLRLIDIDMTGKTWCVSLEEHKTSHHGKSRTILFGPKAQDVIRPFLDQSPIQMPLFSPKEAEEERYSKATVHRRDNQKPNPRRTDRIVGDAYTVASYRKAIHRACDKAGIARWSPNQLRHNAATQIRAEFGLEAAQVVLGHSTADVTQVYAERDMQLANKVAGKIG